MEEFAIILLGALGGFAAQAAKWAFDKLKIYVKGTSNKWDDALVDVLIKAMRPLVKEEVETVTPALVKKEVEAAVPAKKKK